MLQRIYKFHSLFFGSLQVILYALLLYIGSHTSVDSNSLITVGLYCALITSIFVWYGLKICQIHECRISWKECYAIVSLIITATAVSFYVLHDYPFVAVGDSLRDAGLDAARVVSGNLKNMFAGGQYDGFGNSIPFFSSVFYRIFGPSVYTFRVPAAIISILDIGLFYVLIRRITKDTFVSYLASLAYMVLPLHLFYARTELVVIFDSFWTTSILLAFYFWIQKRRYIDIVLLGTLLGIASNFHSAVRVVAIAFALITILYELKTVLFNHVKFSPKIFVFILYCFIGFGPSILYYSPDIFLQKNKVGVQAQMHNKDVVIKEFDNLQQRYRKSLMVWFYEPTGSHYPNAVPLLPPVMGLLFLAGIGYVLYVDKSPFLKIALVLIFLLPLSNSAITDTVNADHRLMPLLPFGAIFAALGMKGLTHALDGSIMKYVFRCAIIISIVYSCYSFFAYQPANNDKRIPDYLSMHSIYEVQSQWMKPEDPVQRLTDTSSKFNLCLTVSSENAKIFDLAHFKEQYEYFLPRFNVFVRGDSELTDNQALMTLDDCTIPGAIISKKKIVTCQTEDKYRCPLNYSGEMHIEHE